MLTFCFWMRGWWEFSQCPALLDACCLPHCANREVRVSEIGLLRSLHPVATRKSSIHIPETGSTQAQRLWNSPVNVARTHENDNMRESHRIQLNLFDLITPCGWILSCVQTCFKHEFLEVKVSESLYYSCRKLYLLSWVYIIELLRSFHSDHFTRNISEKEVKRKMTAFQKSHLFKHSDTVGQAYKWS